MTGSSGSDKFVKLAFENAAVTLKLDQIVALKILRPVVKSGKKYAQIVSSVRAIGLVEAPVVTPDRKKPGMYFLLDGHLRIEALKDLNVNEVECLVSTDDESYTYNKRISRLAAVQEHRMIMRAVDRGVSEDRIAEALGLDVATIRRRFRLLDGICPEAADLLKDTPCPMKVFDILRQMAPMRQVEAADLMIGQGNFSTMFANCVLSATPEKQRVPIAKANPGSPTGAISEQIARMERELASLQSQVKSVEETYGVDNLHLTVAKGYVAKLLSNARVVRWLIQNRQEYLPELQSIAEIEKIGGSREAAE
ncbi:plasmid partitioning protein RepB C-terminal domain-containing protein [Bradyrhizobium sp. AS23.2]|uniref:plasmid partitioning protein RepB C-terminal domain-containing protein n=1 Tax=Bradyrhizobium sp. AS23.2 TaxID=1680155 RepID=UPI0009388E5A|nr:plasmid partitioning protein RepB C-terminal domain-containing protein [Bradyrhizobium sp. AS23.2]OKO67334.1 RepB plasmid partition [Bradyrhizobium sp. AS23.2]